MNKHTIVHIADELKDGLQRCFYCDVVLADYTNAMVPEGSPLPRGFQQGALVGKSEVGGGTFVINGKLEPGEVYCNDVKEEALVAGDNAWEVKVKIDDWHTMIVAFAPTKENARQEVIQIFRRGFVEAPGGQCFFPIHRVTTIDIAENKNADE